MQRAVIKAGKLVLRDDKGSCHFNSSHSNVGLIRMALLAQKNREWQFINNLETMRSYKRTVYLKTPKFSKKFIERFKYYSLIC